MGILKTPEFRVGLLVLVITILIAVMTMKITQGTTWGSTMDTWFLVDDASGLVKNSGVKMAGINIGTIEDIVLYQGKARVEMKLREDVKLTKDSGAQIKANGILGDKYVEVSRGTSEELLSDGEPIINVQNQGGMDAVMNEISSVAKQLGEVATSLKKAAVDGDDKTPLGRIIRNIETVTQDLSEFTHGNKEKLGKIVENLNATLETIENTVNDDDEGLKQAWAKLDRALTNVEEITHKVNAGEGTLGKLVNDDTTIEEINTAVSGVNQMLGVANKIQTSLSVSTEYLSEQGFYKTYLGVKIQPGLDRYYELQVVDDPKGVVENTTTDKTVNGGPTTTTEEIKTFRNRVKFTALFAKNFYDLTVKGGLIESSGGLGIDYYMFKRSLRLSLEAFDFDKDYAHMRASARYSIWKGFFVTAGADDFAGSSGDGEFSSYLGAGLDLTNDDLKAFLSKLSF